ncbi:probable C-mannosyltransferase DPY19L1 isoform X1 [Pelobates cultripes]|uniref:Probable C-mannosyltransferase DPY19L1 isoform X1 n=1 Tax=Pelobates cultripes TaxID=61616 RepID=A0AAD1RX75_PELCU|nr:probable C-mannosyltransferase DPY19L1 isoform X1 [Pelobates cultripes]
MAGETRFKSKAAQNKAKDQRMQKQPLTPNESSHTKEDGSGEMEPGVRQRQQPAAIYRHGATSLNVVRAKNRIHHGSTEAHHFKQLGAVERLFLYLGLSKVATLKNWTILFFAAFVGVLHWSHISTLFENDRHFSHLSTLEREMTFRTEMGLYYSYFKSIVEAPSYYSGLHMIMNDNVTEYPHVINTLKRFNLYPEGNSRIAPKASRSRISVENNDSCPPDSASRLGGFLTVLCFFYNHGECTRVMWTPPLRESFSYPFLVLQMFLLTYILRTPNIGRRSLIALCVSNVFFMLPWQFAQFVLLTQISSLFAIYIVGYIDSEKYLNILYTHMVSLGLCFILMFGNSMLLTSYYASSLIVICVIVLNKKVFLKLEAKECVNWVAAWILGTIILKAVSSIILGIKDDAHISNILKSKFTDYKDFDTLMYTCAPEFDFMEKETPWRYLKTALLPAVLLVFATICVWTLKDIRISCWQKASDVEEHRNERWEYSTSGELVYHALQLVAFAVLAILIMRLKLFLTPHMCIMASLLCSRQLFGWIFKRVQFHMFIFAVVALMTIQGFTNLQNEWNIRGEFSNLPQEELLEWIQTNTKPDAVFAGAMPTMASVKLSTGRPIVNHPHYEDAGLRARTKMVYSMYSRKPAKEVKNMLRNLGVQYFILEDAWCIRRTKPGCSMSEIWDIEDPSNAGKTPLCSILAHETLAQFHTSFQNNVYKVLKLSED